ncbi:DUF6647 family protein [Roseovarius sp. Pro17]|uniref:DUF6647 family protein n=1 Tax=Roseovarius sp. Pro17 TaxID=3108175 RepID=UPI002D7862F9|nr:DUF6647 family protein [Roseovarius sp. Pro17]
MRKSILIALAITLANAAFGSASDDSHIISPARLYELNTWLDAETEFERRDSQPRIRLIAAEQAQHFQGIADHTEGTLRGLYDEETEIIYLVQPWSPNNQRDVSVLVHEMAHHRQSGQHWYCPQAQEWRAYQIQAQWLRERAIADNFYWPAILLQSSCAKRDIHSE